MSDAARTKASSILRRWNETGEALNESLATELDAFAAEQTAALRTALERLLEQWTKHPGLPRPQDRNDYSLEAFYGHMNVCAMEARALLAEPEGPSNLPRYMSERAKIEATVGVCCQGGDPLCGAGCLVDKAWRARQHLAEPEGQRAAEEWRALDELASGVEVFARMFASRLEQLRGPREVVASVRSGVRVLADRLAAVERARQRRPSPGEPISEVTR